MSFQDRELKGQLTYISFLPDSSLQNLPLDTPHPPTHLPFFTLISGGFSCTFDDEQHTSSQPRKKTKNGKLARPIRRMKNIPKLEFSWQFAPWLSRNAIKHQRQSQICLSKKITKNDCLIGYLGLGNFHQ